MDYRGRWGFNFRTVPANAFKKAESTTPSPSLRFGSRCCDSFTESSCGWKKNIGNNMPDGRK